MEKELISDLAKNLAASVRSVMPDGLRSAQLDLEQNFRAILRSSLENMNLVTREEFDIQRRVLERTREKLTRLEADLAALQGRSDDT